jgi:hypothetical protein
MLPEVFIPNTSQQINFVSELGLSGELLQEVGRKALAAYHQTTAHDASGAAGQYAYLAAVRALRDILCPKGWEPHVRHNLEMTVNPETNISIMVSSGDEGTGVEDATPKTKNPKGDQTKRVVAFNARQLRLPTLEYKVQNISISKVWVLLYHTDVKKSQMRLELSLPVEMDMNDIHISGWNKRIILPPVDFEYTVTTPAPKYRKNFIEEFSIELKRKSNG